MSLCIALLAWIAFPGDGHTATDDETASSEQVFLSKIRQLTFEGARAGEGYYSQDGQSLVFQSERDASNPFYQIYLMNRESGDTERISPGHGKTTCAWVHPDGNRVLYASTQFDPEALTKQQTELDFRASGQTRRYSWDYDSKYDLVVFDRKAKNYVQLTHEEGYDAEGSYSPDGKLIAFSSNRRAYSGELSPHEQELFKTDPASALDLYIMRSDGSDVRRITDVVGYDGGPFFSPDGLRICWRRFTEDGARAEIYTANIDGSDVRAMTTLNAMSWAPYFHPSGDYLIFTTNLQGFANFELYAVDAQGEQSPIRITSTDGFDGLPVFSPDGKSLTWTSNRTSNKKSQLFTSDWNDAAVRTALKIAPNVDKAPSSTAQKNIHREEAVAVALENVKATSSDFVASEIGRHVDYLCRPELGGRLTGTEGEKNATAYVAAFMDRLDLKPAGSDATYFQEFPFTSGVDLGTDNRLQVGEQSFKLNEQWRPIVFSKTGEIDSAEVVFAGYGLVAPREDSQAEYDSYVHLDVDKKWVMVFRQLPMDITPERRQHLARYSSLRYKAMVARDRGAIGLIVVSGPTSQVRQQLVPLQTDGALSGSSIAVISVHDEVAKNWLSTTEDDLGSIQSELDKGEMMMGIPIPKVKLSALINIQQLKQTGRNVLGRLTAGDTPSESCLIVGAHIDHLGAGGSGNSLAKDDERGGIHRGADDNASGVAGMLEIAQFLSAQKRDGKLNLKHDIIFAAWSGEELGLIGSSYFADHFEATATDKTSLYPSIVACLNLDMIGRLREKLVLQGIGSSPRWPREIEQRNAIVGLDLVLQNDSYLPTDASTFFIKGVPILSAFTGQHSEYHTPRDTPDLLNYEGAAQTARLLGLIAKSIATRDEIPSFVAQAASEEQGKRANLTAYLGTIPDYIQADIKGVLLSGVADAGPAAAAGVRAKDIIVELAGKKIDNIYDYTFAIEGLRVGQEVEMVIQREKETLRLKVTPRSRQ
ncbi:MAG: M28 family peptidase [Pirellulaceae bacterium]|nr:M28 family peptidase [Pirellulaceae bacterium]